VAYARCQHCGSACCQTHLRSVSAECAECLQKRLAREGEEKAANEAIRLQTWAVARSLDGERLLAQALAANGLKIYIPRGQRAAKVCRYSHEVSRGDYYSEETKFIYAIGRRFYAISTSCEGKDNYRLNLQSHAKELTRDEVLSKLTFEEAKRLGGPTVWRAFNYQ